MAGNCLERAASSVFEPCPTNGIPASGDIPLLDKTVFMSEERFEERGTFNPARFP